MNEILYNKLKSILEKAKLKTNPRTMLIGIKETISIVEEEFSDFNNYGPKFISFYKRSINKKFIQEFQPGLTKYYQFKNQAIYAMLSTITNNDSHTRYLYYTLPYQIIHKLNLNDSFPLSYNECLQALDIVNKRMVKRNSGSIDSIENLNIEKELINIHKKVYRKSISYMFDSQIPFAEIGMYLVYYYEIEFGTINNQS